MYLLDVVAGLLIVLGCLVAFRPGLITPHRKRAPITVKGADQELTEDPEGIASVFRMIGVMIMAFSFTVAMFANLIVYFGAASRAAG